MLTFRWNYFVWALLLFATEAFIAFYVKDKIIRPYGGDVLVVILIYCFLMSFLRIRWKALAWFSLLLSFAVELSQYFGLIYALELEDELWARLVLGTGFHWLDLVAYSLGFIVIYLIEKRRRLSKR